MRKPRAFLNYARENVRDVEELYQELIDAGIQPWMDTKDLLPGQDWELAIKNAIRQADFFVVCLSTQSVNKRGYLQREIKRAQELWDEKLEDDIYLIPARLDNCEVPQSLSKFQWVDLYEDQGFSRLLKSIQVGSDKAGSTLGIEGSKHQEPEETTDFETQFEPKYFYYVSRAKVDMLLPQLRIEGMPEEGSEPLVTKTLRLLDRLQRSNSIVSLEETSDLGTMKFYASKAVWYNGLFYFRTMVSVTVAYFLWRKHGDCIIVLAGSPDNIIGNRVARQGVELSSTGDAIDTIGSSEILEVINTDEVSSAVVGGGRTSRRIPPAKKRVSAAPGNRNFEEAIYTHSREVGLAIFCLSHLSALPEMSLETVFRVYSTYSSRAGNLFNDLAAEHEQGRKKYPTLYSDASLKEAQRMGLMNLRRIYIGSPLYTAVD
jgi:hypothetical protein